MVNIESTTNIRSTDEAKLEALKNARVAIRRRKYQCLNAYEIEAYTLYNRIKQRKNRNNATLCQQ